jgi:hypothetical protein
MNSERYFSLMAREVSPRSFSDQRAALCTGLSLSRVSRLIAAQEKQGNQPAR